MPPKNPKNAPFENKRALIALAITIVTIALLIGVIIHAKWSYHVLVYKQYGSFINNLVFGVGTLVANAGLSIRLVSFLNLKFLDSQIDADHKKYV